MQNSPSTTPPINTESIEVNNDNLENFTLYGSNEGRRDYRIEKPTTPQDILDFINENPNGGFEYHDKMNSLRYSFKEILSSNTNQFKILCHLKSLANEYETNMQIGDVELTIKIKGSVIENIKDKIKILTN